MGWRDDLRGNEVEEKSHKHLTVLYMKLNTCTSSPRRGLTVVLTRAIPNMLVRVMLSEYSVPACSPMM